MEPQSFNLTDLVSVPKEFYMLSVPKHGISLAIKHALERKRMSLKQVARQTEGLNYANVCNIASGERYSIHTLLRLLDALDLEITISERGSLDNK